MTRPSAPAADLPGTPGRAPRDPRLDFFRGVAMFIILLAHTPGNVWALWIPARFGFSDGADIFVFCSGMASALAFGAVFTKRSWWLGAARIAHRVWQVYWAHICVFLVTAIMLFTIDFTGIGNRDIPYTHSPYVVPFFNETGQAMLGLMTLTYVPGLFDILPMYIVILAMIPFLMLIHRAGGVAAVLLAMGTLWLLSNISGWAYQVEQPLLLGGFQALLFSVGEAFSFLHLPSNPFGEGRWFFNPFAWQLIFFTGFCFGMKWLPAPPVNRTLVLIAALYVIAVIPFAWFKIHQGLYLPDDWLIQNMIVDIREAIRPLWWKTDQGALRILHFLAIAYLAWVAVGQGGARLSAGFRTPGAVGKVGLIVAAVVFVATIPYNYVDWIMTYTPALNNFIVWLFDPVATSIFGTNLFADPERIGLLQIAHGIAALVIVWAAIGPARRHWMTHDLVQKVVPVVRKVGTQSLAVFMLSIPLARFNGLLLDLIGRDWWSWWLINGFGAACLIACAYFVGWIKAQPWRAPRESAPSAQTPNRASTQAAPAE